MSGFKIKKFIGLVSMVFLFFLGVGSIKIYAMHEVSGVDLTLVSKLENEVKKQVEKEKLSFVKQIKGNFTLKKIREMICDRLNFKFSHAYSKEREPRKVEYSDLTLESKNVCCILAEKLKDYLFFNLSNIVLSNSYVLNYFNCLEKKKLIQKFFDNLNEIKKIQCMFDAEKEKLQELQEYDEIEVLKSKFEIDKINEIFALIEKSGKLESYELEGEEDRFQVFANKFVELVEKNIYKKIDEWCKFYDIKFVLK